MEQGQKPEIVIGLVGAAGTDLSRAAECVRESLSSFRYTTEDVRLSKLMHAVPGGERLADSDLPEDRRIIAHMDAGDRIRAQTHRNDAVAALAVGWISDYRERETNQVEALSTAFVLNSLKHPDEVETLRRVVRLFAC